MSTAIVTLRMLVRLTGTLLVILGIIVWAGHARGLIPVHMLLGLAFVLSLWALALLVARAGVSSGFVALVIVWGLVVLALGMAQTRLVPGHAHWVIQVIHLVIGIMAIGFGEQLVGRMPRAEAGAARA
jgi:hypothetical protein